MAIHIRIHRNFSVFFPEFWLVDPFQLSFPLAQPLVTPLTEGTDKQ